MRRASFCLLFLLILWFQAPAMAEPRLALVIGNSDYVSLGLVGETGRADAELISTSLEKAGFGVTLVLDASQSEMRQSIAQFSQALADAGPAATGLFYFSGLGMRAGGMDYLVPIRAKSMLINDLQSEVISAGAINEQMKTSGCRTKIMILEVDRINASWPATAAVPTAETMNLGLESFVAYATAPGDMRVRTGGSSLFTAALAQSILQPDREVIEVLRDVRHEILEKTSGAQVPFDSSSLMEPFIFVAD